MKKLWDKMWDWLPMLWATLLVLIITIGGFALVVTVIKWLFFGLGVM